MFARIVIALFIFSFVSCKQKQTLFQSLSPSKTGIDFVNAIEENEKYNVLTYMNMYTGAGVSI